MVKIDKLFPEYKYCPIKEVGNHPKDAKLQFVALVLEKPQIVEGKKLIWTVADRTGVVSFKKFKLDITSTNSNRSSSTSNGEERSRNIPGIGC